MSNTGPQLIHGFLVTHWSTLVFMSCSAVLWHTDMWTTSVVVGKIYAWGMWAVQPKYYVVLGYGIW